MSGLHRARTSVGLLAAAVLAVLALGGARFGPAMAQEATPAVECVPPVGDGEMTATTPEMEGPEASPVAGEEPVGTDADEATAAAVAAAAENFIACWNAGNLGAYLDLVTDDLLSQLGFGDRTEAANELTAMLASGGLPTVTLVEPPHDARVYDDGRVSVDVGFMRGEYQHIDARWFFVQSGSDLLVDEEELLTPDPDVEFVTIVSASVAADEGATLVLDQSTTATVIEALFLHIRNSSDSNRIFNFLQLAEGIELNEDGTLPDGATEGAVVVGTIHIAAGDEADMALVGLPVGLYALVDESDGTTLPLTIVAPAE